MHSPTTSTAPIHFETIAGTANLSATTWSDSSRPNIDGAGVSLLTPAGSSWTYPPGHLPKPRDCPNTTWAASPSTSHGRRPHNLESARFQPEHVALTGTPHFLQPPHFLLTQITPCEPHSRVLLKRMLAHPKFSRRSLQATSAVLGQGERLRNTRRDGYFGPFAGLVPLEPTCWGSFDRFGLCDLDDSCRFLRDFL